MPRPALGFADMLAWQLRPPLRTTSSGRDAGGSSHRHAFVFIKSYAATEQVKDLVSKRFGAEGISVISEGTITAEQIDKDTLIDTHHGASAANAMEQKPGDLIVRQKAQDKFQNSFGLLWKDALEQGLVYNLVDGAAKLGLSMSELGAEYDKLRSARPCSGLAAVSAAERSRTSSSSMASTRACANSSPSLARPLLLPGINSNGRTSAERSWEAPTQRPRAPRPVFKGWASLPNPTLGTTECTPPPARLRLSPSAPTGSACPWSPTASVERCCLLGCL